MSKTLEKHKYYSLEEILEVTDKKNWNDYAWMKLKILKRTDK